MCVRWVFASALDVFGKRRIIIISGFIWKKTADNMHRGFGVGFLRVLWTREIKPLITQMLASQALRSCSRLEHALAYRSRNASLSSLTLRPAVAAALALLWCDLCFIQRYPKANRFNHV